MSDLAPADEYFGHMKMSVLGITNAVRSAAARLDHGDDPDAVINGLAWTEDAIRDWQKHFPRDPWIPKTLSNLHAVYERISSQHGADAFHRIGTWLEHDFPSVVTTDTTAETK